MLVFPASDIFKCGARMALSQCDSSRLDQMVVVTVLAQALCGLGLGVAYPRLGG